MRRQQLIFLLCITLMLLTGCSSPTPDSTEQENPIPIYTATPSQSNVQEKSENDTTESDQPEPTVTTATTATPEPTVTTETADTGDSAYPAPIETDTTDSAYPAPETVVVTRSSAEDAYLMAAEAARGWHEDAYLVSIVPALQMLKNLNIPPQQGGWFFKFMVDNNPDELFVFVVRNRVEGTTIAQPILIEPLPYTEQKIDIDQLAISSEEFKRLFFETEGGASYVDKELDLDYRLIHFDSTPNPVWSAMEAESAQELFHIDAITGEEVESPLAPYLE